MHDDCLAAHRMPHRRSHCSPIGSRRTGQVDTGKVVKALGVPIWAWSAVESSLTQIIEDARNFECDVDVAKWLMLSTRPSVKRSELNPDTTQLWLLASIPRFWMETDIDTDCTHVICVSRVRIDRHLICTKAIPCLHVNSSYILQSCVSCAAC